MENKKDIMAYENTLPEDFDGTFRFTNDTDEEFIGKWGGKEYHFPARSTSPMIMTNCTPLEVQSIRKKFAKNLAEREFFKSPRYEVARLREGERDELGMIKPRGQGMSHAGTYTIDDLTPFIQRCLKPLPVARAVIADAPVVPLESKLTTDNDGELNTIAVKKDGDLIEEKRSLKRKALG